MVREAVTVTTQGKHHLPLQMLLGCHHRQYQVSLGGQIQDERSGPLVALILLRLGGYPNLNISRGLRQDQKQISSTSSFDKKPSNMGA